MSNSPQDKLPVSSPPAVKLGFVTKLAYGAGDMGAGMTANLIAFSFLIFLTNAAGLSPIAAGMVLLIGKVWDAINDPIVGVLSDRTRTRWGRRHPWMFLSAIPFGLTFFLMWLVPNLGKSDGNFWFNPLFWYYVVVSVLFQIFYTTSNLPYTTLTAELTQDYDERTELTSFRLAFSLIGAVLALAFGLVVSQVVPDNIPQQYVVLGGACAIASIIPLFLCIFGTYGPIQRQQEAVRQSAKAEGNSTEEMPLLEQFQVAFSNRPFLFVVGIYLFSWLAIQVTAAIIPYFVTAWMGLDSYYLAALFVQGPAIFMMFICSAISKRVGKQMLYFIGIGSWLIVLLFLFFVQPGQAYFMYLLCTAASFGVATAYIVPWALLPDVIELDELNTGYRREGVFYAFMTLLQKMGLALGLFLVSVALEFANFVEATDEIPIPVQPPSALLAIRVAVAFLPMLFLTGGLILTYFYPITREVHAEILLKLAERRNQKISQHE